MEFLAQQSATLELEKIGGTFDLCRIPQWTEIAAVDRLARVAGGRAVG